MPASVAQLAIPLGCSQAICERSLRISDSVSILSMIATHASRSQTLCRCVQCLNPAYVPFAAAFLANTTSYSARRARLLYTIMPELLFESSHYTVDIQLHLQHTYVVLLVYFHLGQIYICDSISGSRRKHGVA